MGDDDLLKCQEIIGLEITDKSLLAQGLTHASLDDARSDHNERLEFLGDAILGMVICDHVYRVFPEMREGELTRIKSVVVSRRILARKVREMKLDELIRVGKGMAEQTALPRSVLANVYEAIVAVIYLDAGIAKARDFIIRTLAEEIGRVVSDQHERNFKDLLQQYTQRVLGCAPRYKVLEERGPDHMKSFRVVGILKNREYGVGKGQNKKEAEQAAAEATYKELIREATRDEGED